MLRRCSGGKTKRKHDVHVHFAFPGEFQKFAMQEGNCQCEVGILQIYGCHEATRLDGVQDLI